MTRRSESQASGTASMMLSIPLSPQLPLSPSDVLAVLTIFLRLQRLCHPHFFSFSGCQLCISIILIPFNFLHGDVNLILHLHLYFLWLRPLRLISLRIVHYLDLRYLGFPLFFYPFDGFCVQFFRWAASNNLVLLRN